MLIIAVDRPQPIFFNPPMRSVLSILLLLSGSTVFADDASDWAKRGQNPMAEIMQYPVENRFNTGYGHKDGTEYVLTFKPSMISDLSPEWMVVNRLDIPFIYRPAAESGQPDDHGLGDVTYESFYGPRGLRTFYWGIGPCLQLPSATDTGLSSQKWSAGIGATGTFAKGPLVGGILANHLWSFTGEKNEPDVNRSLIEYFAYFNFGNGWSIGTSAENSANWEAENNDIWSVPVGGGIGKVVSAKRWPLNLKLEAYRYIEAPSSGPEWSVIFEMQFLFSEQMLFKPKR